jgi:Protein of unknown function (DUF3293).
MSKKVEEKHEAWSSYPETVLIFAGDPEITIDLREPVPPATKNALFALGLDRPFAILTSYNPRGKVLDATENEGRFAELEAELRSSGIEYLVMDACAPDKSHCECSVAIGIDRSEALRIAERWEQIAIFWWDLDRFWIYGAISPIDPPISLPV